MTFKVAVNGALLLPNKCVLVCLMCPLVHRYSIVTLWYTEINEAVKEIRSGHTSYVGLGLLEL
jgi:hypothetical protein